MLQRIVFFLFISLLFTSCSKKESPPSKPIVFTTIAPYAFALEKIAGNSLQIETLIPQGMNIHTFEPSPKLVEAQSKASIWFRIGEPFEKKIVASLQERNPSLKIVDLQEGLHLLSYHDSVELSPCEGHEHASYDLHTWLSPKLFLKQAKTIAETLIEYFPENRDLYQKNFNDLARELGSLEKKITEILKPYQGQALLVSHPAFGYFCTDFGFVQLSVECEGKDPRPKDIEKLLTKTKEFTIRCVLLQQGYNNRGAILLGKKLQLPIYRVDPYARDYLSNLLQLSKNIAK